MKIVLISLLISISNLLYGQTADVDTACAPIPIVFTAPPGYTSWFWDFKDKGSTSNLENPTHIFTNAAHYLVEFRESQNGPLIGTVLIVIYDKPILSISTDPPFGCRPLKVLFNDLTVYKSGIVPKSWLWVFGDGGADTIKSTSYTYLQAGIVTPSLEVKTNIKGCDVTQAFPDDVTVFDLPKPHFVTDPEPPIACNPPLLVSFNNNSTGVEPITYKWDFGNTTSSVLKDPPPINYTQKADYFISLNAEDKNGCKNTFLDTARVGTNLICLNIKDTICFGDTLFIKNCSPVGFHNWNLGPNAQTKTTKERNPKVVFTVPGLQEIHYKLTVAGLLCELDTTIYVYVQKLDPQILSTVPNHCQAPVKINYTSVPDDFKTYNWFFGFYDSSSVKSPSFIYPHDPDNFSVFGERYLKTLLLVESYAGCKAQVIKIDTLYLLTAAIEVDTNEGKAPLSVKFFDDSYSAPKQAIVYWKWVFGDGKVFITNDSMPPVHTYDSCGLYYPYLIIENALGCKDTSYALTILVQDTLCDGIGFDPDAMTTDTMPGGDEVCKMHFSKKEICWGDTVWLSLKCFGKNEIRFISDGNRLFHCPYLDSVPWVFNHEPGIHSVSVTIISPYGSVYTYKNTDTMLVKGAYARPYYMTNCANPLSVMFIDSSMNATSILWEFPGGKTYTDKIVTHKFDSSGDYLVYLTAFNDVDGCPPSKDSIWIHVREPKALYTIPQDQYCIKDTIKLNAQLSIDVNAGCYKGYTWFFSDELRPITTDKPNQNVIFKTPGKKLVTLEVTDINSCTNSY
ncbi:MAG TPA: PKD domain-containing protein, partial [Saprospiraceae bacterium]|nr:PKD domain-containing protein [Saprospiraceae bacterium]